MTGATNHCKTHGCLGGTGLCVTARCQVPFPLSSSTMPLPVSQRNVTTEIEEQRWVELGLELEEVTPSSHPGTTTATVTLKETGLGKSLGTKLGEILQETRLVAFVPLPAAVSSEAPAPPPLQCLALDFHFRQLSRLPVSGSRRGGCGGGRQGGGSLQRSEYLFEEL